MALEKVEKLRRKSRTQEPDASSASAVCEDRIGLLGITTVADCEPSLGEELGGPTWILSDGIKPCMEARG